MYYTCYLDQYTYTNFTISNVKSAYMINIKEIESYIIPENYLVSRLSTEAIKFFYTAICRTIYIDNNIIIVS